MSTALNLKKAMEMLDESWIVIWYKRGFDAKDSRQLPADAAKHQADAAAARRRPCNSNNIPQIQWESMSSLSTILKKSTLQASASTTSTRNIVNPSPRWTIFWQSSFQIL
jgi:hypothetical protein